MCQDLLEISIETLENTSLKTRTAICSPCLNKNLTIRDKSLASIRSRSGLQEFLLLRRSLLQPQALLLQLKRLLHLSSYGRKEDKQQ